MAVRTDQRASRRLLAESLKRPGYTFLCDPKSLSRRVKVVELQSGDAFVVAASDTGAARFGDKDFLQSATPAGHALLPARKAAKSTTAFKAENGPAMSGAV